MRGAVLCQEALGGGVRWPGRARKCPRRPEPQFPHEKNWTDDPHLL